jgi:hypothetical protein
LVRTYKPKNRYCHRTKLSEREFLAIFHGYSSGLTATDTHKLISGTAELNVSISRQAVEGIFLRLGSFLWENFVRAKMEVLYQEHDLEAECESFDHFVVYYLDMMRQAIEGEIDYKEYRKDGIEIGSMGAVKRLYERSQKFNGLPAKTFHCHFAYASFIDTMEAEIEKGRFTMEEVKIMLLSEFEKNPL